MPTERSSRNPGKRTWIPFLVLLTSLLLTAIATYSAARLFRTRDHLQFANGIQQTKEAIERRLETYTEMLVLGSTLYGANDEVTRDEFRAYVQRLGVNERYPGIRGIGFSLRLMIDQKEELTQRMRQQGFDQFKIWPEQEGRTECHSIVFLEPLDARNERAIGYDMSTEPVRRKAMDRARDSGLPAASGKVTLVQEMGEHVQPGFLIYVPVYRGGKIPSTIDERRRELLGFVYSPFRTGDLLRGIFGDEHRRPVDFRVFDGAERTADNLLYESPRATEGARQPRFQSPHVSDIAGRIWTLDFASGEILKATSWNVVVPFLALVGVAVSLVVFRLTSAQAAAYRALQKGAMALQTSQADLAASEELHRMVTDGAADVIISTDHQGLICSVNPATEQTFGYSAAELSQKPLSLLLPGLAPASAPEDVEFMACHKSGQEIPVEVSLSSYMRRGHRFITAVIRNITHRRQSEAVQKRQADLMALRAEVSTALARAGGSIPDVLQGCADAVVRRLSPAFAGVWTISGSLHTPELCASAGIANIADDVGKLELPKQNPIQQIISELQPCLIHSLPEDSSIPANWITQERLTSFAGCPLMVEGNVIGVLGMFARQPMATDTLDVLTGVADLIAQGIERKRVERTLRESEDRLRVAVESAELGTWDLYPLTQELRWSARCKELFGLSPDAEVTYPLFLSRIYPEDAEAVRQASESALAAKGDGHYEIDFRSLWPDGTVRWISAKGRAFFDDINGERQAVRFTGTALDVTRRKHAEETARFLAETGPVLSESLNYETTLTKLAQLAVPRVADWCVVDMVDPSGMIEQLEVAHSNQAKVGLAKAFRRQHQLGSSRGHGRAEVIRTGKPELYTHVTDSLLSNWAQDPEHLRMLRLVGMKSAMIVPIKARDRVFGALTFVFSDSGRAYATDDLNLAERLAVRAGLAVDNALLYRAAQQEITERKRVEEQIQQLNQDLEQRVRRRTTALQETNEQLEAFTYTVAHDLRAPLRAMQGFSQALVEDYAEQLDAPGRDYVTRVAGAAERMDALIQDLLAYSRLSRIQLVIEPIGLEMVIDRVLLTLAHEIRKKQAVLQVERPLPKVRGHAGTLEHVVANLVSNALKFVPPGLNPRIRLWTERGPHSIFFSVSDNGIGIPPEFHERIFRVFERLHGSDTFPGTGIGLAIVRKGVERMGGRAGVESQPGQGSRFWIELPKLEFESKAPSP